MKIHLLPMFRVRVLHATLVNAFDPARRARWAAGAVYAGPNPHACDGETCSCSWVLWPEGDAGDWCVVGRADFEVLARCEGPAFDVCGAEECDGVAFEPQEMPS